TRPPSRAASARDRRPLRTLSRPAPHDDSTKPGSGRACRSNCTRGDTMNSIEGIPAPNRPELDRRVARANAEKLVARRRRHIQMIRKRAIVGSVAVFAAAWGAIGFQLVSGHDPALARNSQAAV